LFTKNGRALTAIGVKPICPFQQIFQSVYLYGVFSPLNGNHFLLELSQCNSILFELFLTEFSKENEEELKVIILDNGAFHKTKNLKIPHNIILIFLPAYSPELNPAERVWREFKRDFTNKNFENIEKLKDYVCDLSVKLTNSQVLSLTGYDYIFLDSYWTIL